MKIRMHKKSLPVCITSKILLVFMLLLIVIGVPIQMVQKVSADQYDDQITALQQDVSKYQAQEAVLNDAATTLQTALGQLANQEAAIQDQIDISQAKYNQLIIQIADTEQKIKDNQDALGKTIANMYVNDQITPLEMLASSKSIGDYLDKQEYRSSVRNELINTITKIKDLKNQLDKQQSDVKQTLTEQQSAKDALVTKTNEQQDLLNQTQGQESAYQQMIGDSQAKIAEAKAIQATINRRGTSTGGYNVIVGGLLPEYVTDDRYGSWNDNNCPVDIYGISSGGVAGLYPDGQDGHGYGCRQCTSYVAWKINQEKHYYPSWGDARNFTSHGTPTSPHKGVVAVLDAGASGHVAWVETDPYISTTGSLKGQTVIQVSQYNFDYGQGYGMYSLMELSVNFFDHYVSV
jgi:peptidoglycan hydrolase CwlO-like protein